jgi:diaminohydroxyphosphoribosylaminopyrimidine deaminase/5-amino-6-(5-phosphoribosylamino)uracil reductase
VNGQNPTRIVIDSQLSIQNSATIFNDEVETIIFNRLKNEKNKNIHFYKLESIDTKVILKALYELGIQSVFIEGGSRTLQHFLVNHDWDEARVIVGNSVFHDGIKAPVMQGVPKFHQEFSNDKIYYYFCK